jgi:hypothetical protein
VAQTFPGLASRSFSSWFGVERPFLRVLLAFCLHVLSDWHSMQRNDVLESVGYLWVEFVLGERDCD